MKKIIIHPSLLDNKNIENPILIDPENTRSIIKTFGRNNNEIEVYDITHSKEHQNNEIIEVSDHINLTGNNPLIGYQQYLQEQFIDIYNLYNTNNGITCQCLGRRYNRQKFFFKYPSTYLCYIPIILKALKKEKIRGFLINKV